MKIIIDYLQLLNLHITPFEINLFSCYPRVEISKWLKPRNFQNHLSEQKSQITHKNPHQDSLPHLRTPLRITGAFQLIDVNHILRIVIIGLLSNGTQTGHQLYVVDVRCRRELRLKRYLNGDRWDLNRTRFGGIRTIGRRRLEVSLLVERPWLDQGPRSPECKCEGIEIIGDHWKLRWVGLRSDKSE